MTSEYTDRTLGAKTPITIHHRMRDLLRASPRIPMAGQNDELFPKLPTTMRRLSVQASWTSSRAKSGPHAYRERKETERRSAREGGTGKIEAYDLCSLLPLDQIGSVT